MTSAFGLNAYQNDQENDGSLPAPPITPFVKKQPTNNEASTANKPVIAPANTAPTQSTQPQTAPATVQTQTLTRQNSPLQQNASGEYLVNYGGGNTVGVSDQAKALAMQDKFNASGKTASTYGDNLQSVPVAGIGAFSGGGIDNPAFSQVVSKTGMKGNLSNTPLQMINHAANVNTIGEGLKENQGGGRVLASSLDNGVDVSSAQGIADKYMQSAQQQQQAAQQQQALTSYQDAIKSGDPKQIALTSIQAGIPAEQARQIGETLRKPTAKELRDEQKSQRELDLAGSDPEKQKSALDSIKRERAAEPIKTRLVSDSSTDADGIKKSTERVVADVPDNSANDYIAKSHAQYQRLLAENKDNPETLRSIHEAFAKDISTHLGGS